MRLIEAIIDANHRAVQGEPGAGLRPADYADSLPLVALTCIDPRLNPLMPEVLGIPEEQFIWLRNAGNIVTGPLSSTLRSLSLACAVKGGKEIALIGHTDCQIAKCTAFVLIERLRAIGVERRFLPDNLNEFFGMFGSERQNIIKGTEYVRNSPLIGPNVPVHGLVVDIETGKLEWLVNGYETPGNASGRMQRVMQAAGKAADFIEAIGDFQKTQFKMPDLKIGDVVSDFKTWASQNSPEPPVEPPAPPPPPVSGQHVPHPPAAPPRIPLPPRVKPKLSFKKTRP